MFFLHAQLYRKEAHATNQYVDQCQVGPQTADCCIRQYAIKYLPSMR